MPIPVSISTSASAVSTSRQWHTIRAPVQPPSPLTILPPYGHNVPQLRWWIFAAIGAILAQIGHAVCTSSYPCKPRSPRHVIGSGADRGVALLI